MLWFSVSVTRHLPAQNESTKVENSTPRPFKILTSGKKITIQSKQNLKTVIVWTANGHRLIEEKNVNATTYSFNVTIPEKVFFVRVDMEDGKMYTQKLGVQ
jgi:hypothetical protein